MTRCQVPAASAQFTRKGQRASAAVRRSTAAAHPFGIPGLGFRVRARSGVMGIRDSNGAGQAIALSRSTTTRHGVSHGKLTRTPRKGRRDHAKEKRLDGADESADWATWPGWAVGAVLGGGARGAAECSCRCNPRRAPVSGARRVVRTAQAAGDRRSSA